MLGTVVNGPASFLFFGLHIIQETDMSVIIHGDEKLDAINCFPIDRDRRKQLEESLNAVELRSFRSVNSSIGWLGTNESLFCASYSSWLQQKTSALLVKHLIDQINALKLLKKLGSTIRYKSPDPGEYKLSLLEFSDASRKNGHGQLSFLSGLIFGDLIEVAVFHAILWSSHKSRRPAKSIASAEVLAAGEAIDEGKVIVKVLNELLGQNLVYG